MERCREMCYASNIPHAEIFVNVHRRVHEQDSFRHQRNDTVRYRSLRIIEAKERVIQLEENSAASFKRIAVIKRTVITTTWKIPQESI